MVTAEAHQERLTVRAAAPAEILPYVASAGRFGTRSGSGAVERVAHAGQGFIVAQDGADILGYTLEIDGTEVFITAASGAAGFDLVAAGLAIIEAQAAGYESVGFRTKRRGLVRKAQRQGYEIAAYIMRKKIK